MTKDELRKEFYTVMEYKEPFGNEYHDELFNWMWSKIEQLQQGGVVRPALDSSDGGGLLATGAQAQGVCACPHEDPEPSERMGDRICHVCNRDRY